jgi:branched-chain amino acid transport system permease protein
VVAQQILNGLIVGSVYALFALGFTLIFGVMNILNMAHGAVFMWGALIGLYCVQTLALPLPLAFLLACIGSGFLSLLIDQLVFRPMRQRDGDEFGGLVGSIGASLVLISAAQQFTHAEIMNFPFGTFPIHHFEFAGLRVSLLQLSMVGCLVLMAGGLFYYLYGMPFGRQVRAVAVSERTALLLGVDPKAVYRRTFFIAGALAGAAGVILGLAFNSVHFLMGDSMMLRAFVVIVLGGMGSVQGAVLAGLLLGVVQTTTVAYLSSQLSDAIIFGLLFLVLLFKPTGFFQGLKNVSRVTRS